jgi:LPXTG-site transpeptidase (sortase) family protein
MKKFRPIIFTAALGVFLVLAGAFMLISIIRSQESNFVLGPPPTVSQAQIRQANYIGGIPVSLQIASLHMNLQIIPGVYNPKTKTWNLTLNKVQYATVTPMPNNESGNTFMYGHYRPEVFAYLHTIHANAQAVVTTANGHQFYYQLVAEKVISPNDSAAVFNYSGPPILTLQTCTGLFFQSRQLFTFDLVKVV